MLGKLLSVVLATQAVAYCAKGTGGTCKHLSCSSKHGPTNCESGSCVCPHGYCSTLGTCFKAKHCVKDTGGSCSIFGCKSWRGDTKCESGKCVCKHGGCVLGDTGVCSYGCEKNSGGSCSLFSCKSSRGPTDCVGGSCLCKKDYCASNGVCYPQKEDDMMQVFTNATELPASWQDESFDADSKGALAALACVVSLGIMLGAVGWRRRNQKSELSDSLLPGYAPEENVAS